MWENAPCRDAGPGLFFAPDGERRIAKERREREAKAACAGCPFKAPCLEIGKDCEWGIYGGLTPEDRNIVPTSAVQRMRERNEEFREQYATGKTYVEIAAMYAVSVGTVGQALRQRVA